VYRPLSGDYRIERFKLKADWFGVPQQRERLFFVGFRNAREFTRFAVPEPTHRSGKDSSASNRTDTPDLFAFSHNEDPAKPSHLRTMGVREALGLSDIGFDDLAPTLRSGFTGPRGATSVNSSTAALRAWGKLCIWPHGVAVDRASARLFVPENGHFRLSLQDCAILQGFPENWSFAGPVYAVLGQIGNSVAPPMGYRIALAVARALSAP
jgi:DNA (cytosine-5)-methyltransferase 1